MTAFKCQTCGDVIHGEDSQERHTRLEKHDGPYAPTEEENGTKNGT